MFMKRRWLFVGLITLLFIGAGFYFSSTPSPEAEAQGITGQRTDPEVGEIRLLDAGELAAAEGPQLSADELQALVLRKLELREQVTSQVNNNPPSPPGLPLVRGRAAQIDEPVELDTEGGEFHGTPSTLVLGRNNKNTRANDAALGSTLAEPAAANNARLVFSAGNFRHAEFSTNGGATYTNVPLPGGPADAPILCCDHDVVIDDARRVTFHSALYINSSVTNGVVRIFVRRNIGPVADCALDIDPAGTANNILPDYPHLGLTKQFLYLTINAIPTAGTGFARIHRINIDQLVDCVAAPAITTFTQSFSPLGQRVWVPAEGTNNIETMYWAQLDNTTTFRIFSWPEAAAAPTSVTRTLSASTFTNPDCRGGTNNTDWIERSTAFSIAGFRLRTAVAPGAVGGPGVLASYWNVGPDAAHTQGHIHAAVWTLSDFTLMGQPHIFNNSQCFGYPVVTANKRGDLGISLASGGKAGGAGPAVTGAVGVDDEFTSGVGVFSLVNVASGTHNPADERYGDYFTIHPHEPCEKWFTATSYALLDGTGVANVNSRYVEFGRQQSVRCYRAHRNQTPAR
jgi:hypothetical protein